MEIWGISPTLLHTCSKKDGSKYKLLQLLCTPYIHKIKGLIKCNYMTLGLRLRKKPRGLNFATCHLVLAHVSVLGWGWLCWRLRLLSLSCSRDTLSSELLRLRYLCKFMIIILYFCSYVDAVFHMFLFLQVPLKPPIGIALRPACGIHLRVKERAIWT